MVLTENKKCRIYWNYIFSKIVPIEHSRPDTGILPSSQCLIYVNILLKMCISIKRCLGFLGVIWSSKVGYCWWWSTLPSAGNARTCAIVTSTHAQSFAVKSFCKLTLDPLDPSCGHISLHTHLDPLVWDFPRLDR